MANHNLAASWHTLLNTNSAMRDKQMFRLYCLL